VRSLTITERSDSLSCLPCPFRRFRTLRLPALHSTRLGRACSPLAALPIRVFFSFFFLFFFLGGGGAKVGQFLQVRDLLGGGRVEGGHE
jgi:hypothetical protein